jgi:hypothetical protein
MLSVAFDSSFGMSFTGVTGVSFTGGLTGIGVLSTGTTTTAHPPPPHTPHPNHQPLFTTDDGKPLNTCIHTLFHVLLSTPLLLILAVLVTVVPLKFPPFTLTSKVILFISSLFHVHIIPFNTGLVLHVNILKSTFTQILLFTHVISLISICPFVLCTGHTNNDHVLHTHVPVTP